MVAKIHRIILGVGMLSWGQLWRWILRAWVPSLCRLLVDLLQCVLTNSTAGNPCNSQIRFTAESEHNEMRYILTIDIVVLCKDCIKRHYGRVHIKSESLDKYKNWLLNLSVQVSEESPQDIRLWNLLVCTFPQRNVAAQGLMIWECAGSGHLGWVIPMRICQKLSSANLYLLASQTA